MKTPVHVDWIRFTVLCRNQPAISFDPAASVARGEAERLYRTEQKIRDLVFPPMPHGFCASKAQIDAVLDETPDPDYHPAMQALQLAFRVAGALGPDFKVSPDVGKGHDFYKFRWIITRNDSECGWVGFLASSDSPKQQVQAKSLHVNLFGTACTFAQVGFNHRICDLVDELDGVLTRCDLALDFFEGYPGGIQAVMDEYRAGLCNVNGRRIASNTGGDWANGHARSIYFGSRSSGKITNCYEKGDQLFGADARVPWIRAELRYGNKLRILPSDMLRRPADFFASASDWHERALKLADAAFTPEPVPCIPRLALDTVEAECFKNVKWAAVTLAPTFTAFFKFLDIEQLAQFCENKKLPARLAKFSPAELARAFTAAVGRFKASESVDSVLDPGAVSTYSIAGFSPACG